MTTALQKRFNALNCTKPKGREQYADPSKPMVACAADGSEKYILGPVQIFGNQITDASFGQDTNQQGVSTGGYLVNLSMNSSGAKKFEQVTQLLGQATLQSPKNRFAVVLDGEVISAPYSQAVITNGQSQISGGFTLDQVKTLANQLKYGALPLSFREQTRNTISPELGSDQLTKGLLAGAIGLLLVVLYSLAQYRLLGLVTISSLTIAAIVTYVAICLLGWSTGFRLTLAGVTGAIVSIGITADSFIVYFERVRDEVRAGRPLRSSVDSGWVRARRTILISDSVNFLAAAVLYLLSESNVRGFAFTLGLTTIIDVLVVMTFTHPMLTILSTTRFFGGGHKLSGFDPEHLGARGMVYAGRGRVTLADRRAAAAQPGASVPEGGPA